jgi:hypothetical protein
MNTCTRTIMLIALGCLVSWADEPVGLAFNPQRYDLLARSFYRMDSLTADEILVPQKKSALSAALYSAILPGSGELYAQSYWKAALFFGLELAGWTAYAVFEHKGDQEDSQMRAYADKNWSEHRYWSKLYYDALQQGDIPNLPAYDLEEAENGYLLAGYDSEMANSLRFLEDELGHTHKLPVTKTQQYYEMIYKYLTQFGNAWVDADFYFTYYGNTDLMTPMMFEYRGIRNEMNNYYDMASTSLNAILINHVLSALDAALTTRKYNRTISASIRLQQRKYYGEKVYVYGLQVSW